MLRANCSSPDWIAARDLRGIAPTRRRVAATLEERGETASRSPDCAASLRRTIPISVTARAESCVQCGSLDAVSMVRLHKGYGGRLSPRSSSRSRPAIQPGSSPVPASLPPASQSHPSRAGALAGRRSIRRERERAEAGTTVFASRGASTESRRAGYWQATSALAHGRQVAER
jgi:hypothetical protein